MLIKIKGVHRVKKHTTQGDRYYYYTHRGKGAKQFWVSEHQPLKSPYPEEFLEAYNAAKITKKEMVTFADALKGYASSHGFKSLKPATQSYYKDSFDDLINEFGEDQIEIFESVQMRKDVIEWHQSFSDKPKKADKCLGLLVVVLNYCVSQGHIKDHIVKNIKKLYKQNRSDVIWFESDIKLYHKYATSNNVRWILDLACTTGLRLEDLKSVSWSNVYSSWLEIGTSKSNRSKNAIIPRTQRLNTLLSEINAHRERIKSNHQTILTNTKGLSWTKQGLSSSFRKTCAKAGIKKRLHDCRGTFATLLHQSGYSNSEIADTLGWSQRKAESLINTYVMRERIMKERASKLNGILGKNVN